MFDHFDAAWKELTAEGSGFAVSEIDVRGIPTRVFPSAPPNMRAIWELAQLHGDKTYIVFEDERYTYAEIGAQVRSLAHHLRDVHGVSSGDRVAIAMRNYPEWVVSYWATLSIGAAAVGMNAWWTGPEMAYGLGDSRPKVLIADDERVERVLPELDALRAEAPLHLISVRSDRELPSDSSRWADVVRPDEAPATLPDAEIDPDDDVTIFYTSGTTGFPKGAQLTHRGSVHNIMNIIFMTMAAGAAEQKAIEAGDLPAPEPAAADAEPAGPPVFLAPTPLFHVTANNCLLQPCTMAGGTIVFMYKWDAGRAIELIEREQVTNFSGVPTMSREMLMHEDWSLRDTSSLKSMAGGGAAVQPDLVDKIDKTLTGGVPSTGYGLTETHGIVTANSAKLYTAKPASCGRIVPTLEGRLEDEAGNVLEPGPNVVGELCVRGAVVIKGYLNRPEATADAIRDGWFHTGDIARIDEDGYVFIVDRAKDMVIRGGENVYCTEVEAAIYEHPAVAEAAVFGKPDDRLGEEVAAAVVVRPGETLTQEQLTEFLAERISKFKIPSVVWFRDEPLPRNANGKFVKRELRDQLVGTA
ncbi:MAG: AMP-dependent synthetase [Acidimicrobiaceae bacterium]|nr:AMP-dependent synthetase [Acidimicrobiaceae bacterium]